MGDNDNSAGVRGDEPGDAEKLTRTEIKQFQTAIINRWPIPAEHRAAMMRRLAIMALDPKSNQREAIAASRAILYADRINLDAEQGPGDVNVNVGVGVDVQTGPTAQEILAEARKDPLYLEFVRAGLQGAKPAASPNGNGKARKNGKASKNGKAKP